MKIKRKIKAILLFSLALLSVSLAAGCKKETEKAVYQRITPQKAKEIMETESGYIILDVRTGEEFSEGHIEGAFLLPDYEIEKRAEEALVNKDKLLLVYCRSGRRSAAAAKKLIELGYTRVFDFGGIIDWEYGTVR